MAEPKIAQRMPYVREEKPGEYWWCACGHSKNQPFCDGSHKASGGGITPVRVQLTEGKKVAWCGCKHTNNKPFCDGSHSRLPK